LYNATERNSTSCYKDLYAWAFHMFELRILTPDSQGLTNIKEGYVAINFLFYGEAKIIIHGVYLGKKSLVARMDMQ